SLGLVGARSLDNYTERRHIKCEMKAPWMNPGVRELAALSALAALGCGLAAAQGDLLFVALCRHQRSCDCRGDTTLTMRPGGAEPRSRSAPCLMYGGPRASFVACEGTSGAA